MWLLTNIRESWTCKCVVQLLQINIINEILISGLLKIVSVKVIRFLEIPAFRFWVLFYMSDFWCNIVCNAFNFILIMNCLVVQEEQPGLIKIRNSLHFLCNTVLCTLLHVSPQIQREIETSVWVALKHRLNTWTLGQFYYIDVSTYCCFFITLLQKHIVAAEFKYPGSVPKS